MNRLIIILIYCFILQGTSTSSDYSNFFNFNKRYKIPESIRRDCSWHYAVVKISTDINNKIVKYELLNDVKQDVKDSFKYLLTYRFPSKIKINRHPIVFCLTVDNQKPDCLGAEQIHVTNSEAISEVMGYFNNQYKKDPKTIFLYEPMNFSFGQREY